MDTVRSCSLCLTILLSLATATSALLAVCPPGKDGHPSDQIHNVEYVPVIGQSQELKCHSLHDILPPKSKLLWFKDGNQVPITNTSDGRVTVSERVVQVPENVSHLYRRSQGAKLLSSVLSIRNVEKADHGRYKCYVFPDNDSTSKMAKRTHEFPVCSYTLYYPDTDLEKLVDRRLTKTCKTHLTCLVVHYPYCPCDTDSCRMLLIKDGKMVASSTSVELKKYTFKSTLKISIDGPEDFGRYDCVLKQLVVDFVDGSTFENSRAGISLYLRQPTAHVKKPQRAFITSGKAHLSCLFEKWFLPILTVPKWKTWEVVLRKDGKEIASKETPLSPDNTVWESFSLKKTPDVYGRYECVIRQTHHGCMKQSWFEEPDYGNALIPYRSRPVRPDLQPHIDVDSIPLEDDGGNIVSANFEIEVKDPTSFGIYDCILEKDGLPDPNAKDITAESSYVYSGSYFHNTFQITPSTIWRPLRSNHERLENNRSVPVNLNPHSFLPLDTSYHMTQPLCMYSMPATDGGAPHAN
uniref:Ig-like domain-containing protein n=1 Tax=Branchiostoma floridae TaxID=7739 RepID=C3YL24_BRAFL|eukprot:XP_002603003.1 hypothetical protein BRAFLDRAFT_84738 [Branchiostoma floridae]